MPEARQAIRFRVTGRVQGVWFRDFTRGAARELGVAGWVRNQPDGSVAGEAAATPAALDAFTARLEAGSPSSRVDRVETSPLAEVPEGRDFEIRYS